MSERQIQLGTNTYAVKYGVHRMRRGWIAVWYRRPSKMEDGEVIRLIEQYLHQHGFRQALAKLEKERLEKCTLVAPGQT